jgi:hypothetical protein
MGRISMGRVDLKIAVSTAAFLILSGTLSCRCCRRQIRRRRPQHSSTLDREALWRFWLRFRLWMLAVQCPCCNV